MDEPGRTLLSRIEALRDDLTPSEARVADVVLASPHRAIEWSIGAMSAAADVSEPTVARFCKSLGFSGLKEFKIQLARSLGETMGTPFVHQDVTPDDSAGDAALKVIGRAVRALEGFGSRLDSGVLKSAAGFITRARRVEFYGQGNSGVVALDAQHKFFRLGLATSAYSDPHVHAMSAALLGPEDVVVAISAGGRTLDLIRSVEIAKAAGATIVGLTTRGSPLARHCDLTIATDVEEDADIYAPMTSRLVHLTAIDVLAVLVALEVGPGLARHLERAKQSVREKRAAK
jgi:RpiR family carbohydrate utilization transcriptional regulator